ncbi:unnamed protein product [Ascophyllum nodosum]
MKTGDFTDIDRFGTFVLYYTKTVRGFEFEAFTVFRSAAQSLVK